MPAELAVCRVMRLCLPCSKIDAKFQSVLLPAVCFSATSS
ncbi:rCG50889 [Rattus norvegicus]|uniref:RCG50889 n=1 Tax=Rattus norvegicus TaxID=10116 RepID=A6KJ30_RAT|nr:rCG50889 [Rattus norvegicus]